jgi:hypothetical protein
VRKPAVDLARLVWEQFELGNNGVYQVSGQVQSLVHQPLSSLHRKDVRLGWTTTLMLA